MSSLDAIVRAATVRIAAPAAGYDGPDEAFWGTGCFVAPCWVLTCAHVLGKGGDGVWDTADAVGVTWPGGRATGTVRLALPTPARGQAFRSWPAPDLALVEVPGAVDVDCVWLSDREAFRGCQVSLHGWSTETGTRAYRPVTSKVEGQDGELLLLSGQRPVAGTSGGPVVDTVRGEVIGLCKARDGTDPRAGVAVPLTELRTLHQLPDGAGLVSEVLAAHDRHHLGRLRSLGPESSWTDAQIELRGDRLGRFDPTVRTELFGRLAALTPPESSGEVVALVDKARHRIARRRPRNGEEPAPHSWREGVGLLYLRDEDEQPELMGVVLYAAHVASAVGARGHEHDWGPLQDLREWVRRTAQPLIEVRQDVQKILDGDDPATGKRSRPRGAVRVVVHPCSYGDRYPWEVKLVLDGDAGEGPGTVVGFDGDDTGHRRAELSVALRAPLAAALNQCDVGGQLAPVEFMVPRDLFDEPFDTWELAPRRIPSGGLGTNPLGLPLGQRRFVTLRDLERTTVGATQEWQGRWEAQQSGPLTAVPLRAGPVARLHGGPERGESWYAAYDRLSGAPPGSVPVFCHGVGEGGGSEAMDAALAAGHPVVIWRSQAAAGHKDCAEFQRRAEDFVAGVGTAERLHGPLRSLRILAADPEAQDPNTRWARSIALLYDPPDAGAGGPVHEPYLAPEGPW